MSIGIVLRVAVAVGFLSVGSVVNGDIIDTPTHKALYTPAGSPALSLPLSDWEVAQERNKPDGTGVYYHLTSNSTQLNFSVYIDKSTHCLSAESCLKSALENPTNKAAQQMQLSTIGEFHVAQFFLDEPQGFPVKQAHIIAAAYVDGHWFDVHISLTGKDRPSAASLLELMQAVTIR